jgi:hypothetical protein
MFFFKNAVSCQQSTFVLKMTTFVKLVEKILPEK